MPGFGDKAASPVVAAGPQAQETTTARRGGASLAGSPEGPHNACPLFLTYPQDGGYGKLPGGMGGGNPERTGASLAEVAQNP